MGRNSCCVKQKLRKGLWSPEEDEKLYNYISRFGVGCWSSVPKLAGLQRCGKSCRLRWINYLRPDLKRGMFSQQEEDLIINLHEALGNRWAQIAAQLPGRTDNEIKNFWNSSLKKKLLKQGVDPNTHKPMNEARMVIKDERESADLSSQLQINMQQEGHQRYNLSSLMINEGKMQAAAAVRESFSNKQVYDPLFLSEFQANVDLDHGFQSNFLSHYERENHHHHHINPMNPICGSFNSMPNLSNFDHQQNLGGTQYSSNHHHHSSSRMSKFVMDEGKESSGLNFHHSSMMMQTMNNNNNSAFSWDDERKMDSVFQSQFSGIQIEERINNEKVQNQINSDDFAAYPLNMSVFDRSI